MGSNSSSDSEASNTITIYAPYHCSKCKYIWQTQENFKYHLQHLCCKNPNKNKQTAELNRFDKFENKHTTPHIDDLKVIPKNRCDLLIENDDGIRRFCLRKLDKDNICPRHSVPKKLKYGPLYEVVSVVGEIVGPIISM